MATPSRDYILLYRSTLNHWLWPKDRPFTEPEAWIYLLCKAAHSVHKEKHDRRLVTVFIGEYISNKTTLAKAWGWDRRTVRTFLEMLEEDDMICSEPCTRTCTRLKIMNYALFQGKSEADCTELCPEHGTELCPDTCTELAQIPSLKPKQPKGKKAPKSKGNKGISKVNQLTPIPPDFSITDSMRAWALKTLGDVPWLEMETLEFKSYWESTGEERKDWEQTWRVRMLNQYEYRQKKGEVYTIPTTGGTIADIDPMFGGAT